MIIIEDTPLANKCIVVDSGGKIIDKIKSFDTETKEAEVYVTVNNRVVTRYDPFNTPEEKKNHIVTTKCYLPGCKAINKKTREEIK